MGAAKGVKTGPNGTVHRYNGYPHLSSLKPGHCMCVDTCCQNPQRGCVCLVCPCREGKPHNPGPFNLRIPMPKRKVRRNEQSGDA